MTALHHSSLYHPETQGDVVPGSIPAPLIFEDPNAFKPEEVISETTTTAELAPLPVDKPLQLEQPLGEDPDIFSGVVEKGTAEVSPEVGRALVELAARHAESHSTSPEPAKIENKPVKENTSQKLKWLRAGKSRIGDDGKAKDPFSDPE